MLDLLNGLCLPMQEMYFLYSSTITFVIAIPIASLLLDGVTHLSCRISFGALSGGKLDDCYGSCKPPFLYNLHIWLL